MNLDTETMEVVSGYGKARRQVVLGIGKEYVIQPLNPRKTKNRDRRCVLLEFAPVSQHEPDYIKAKVRYLDSGRIGRIELEDLAPV
jgi:hypothetical protein